MIYFFELVGIFFQKPMIFGYYSAGFGLFFLTFAAIISLLISKKLIISYDDLKLYIICLVYLIVNCVNNYFLGGGFGVVKDIIIGFFVLTSLLLVFINFNSRSLKKISFMLGLIIYSTFITVVISGFNVDNYKEIIFFDFAIKDRKEIDFASVLFPFSTIPWRMTLDSITLPRATYLTIEPGVGVFVLLLWRYLNYSLVGVKSFIYDIIFIIGLVLTASTTIPIILVCWFMGRYIYKNGVGVIFNKDNISLSFGKIFIIVAILIFCVYLFFYMPYFGYFDKINTHGESFDTREDLYKSDTGILRYLRALLLIFFYFSIRKLVHDNFYIIYLAMFSISVLNVFAFTPIFFFTVYLCRRKFNN